MTECGVITSWAQDELWLRARLTPGSPTDTLHRVYEVTGRLDLDALCRAWQRVVAEHPMLRTTIADVDGRPVPIRHAVAENPLTTVDAKGDTPVVLDPAEGPLARLFVARLDDTHHRVVLVAHATVADEHSMSIVVDALSAAYAGATGGTRPDYVAHARWQRDLATAPEFTTSLDWWTAALTPLPAALVLPTDRDRPRQPSYGGGVVRFRWDIPTAAGSPPAVAVLAAFGCLLGRYSGADRVAIGVPVTTRRPEFDGVVGPFENLLVHRIDLSGRPTFHQLLDRVAGTWRNARANRDVPFHRVAAAVDAVREPGRIPLCDALFVAPERPAATLAIPGAAVTPVPLDGTPVLADLVLTVEPETGSLAGSLAYRAALFDPAAAAGILGQLRTLLAAAIEHPDVPMDTLPLDEPERARAVTSAADRLTDGCTPGIPVHEAVRRQARHRPDAVAVAAPDGTVSYQALERESAAIAGWLRRCGPVDGAAVAVRMAHGPRQLAASLGVLDAGGYLVWFGAEDAGERGRAVLADLRPTFLLLDRPPESDELARWYAERLGGIAIDVTAIGVTAIGATGATPALSAAGLGATRAYVAYTSGSTGRPKGIPQTHGALAQFAGWMAEQLGIGPGSRVAQWVAPEHDPSICEVFATLVSGGTLVPVPDRVRIRPERLLDWLAAERVTFLQTVPSFARELLRAIVERGAAERLRTLDRLVLMGEVLPADLVNGLRAALPTVELSNVYGPTETIAATWYDITGPVAGTVPVGRAIPGRHVLVLDELDRPCPTAVTGEVVIRSPYVTPGYIGSTRPGSAFRLLATLDGSVPCYRTGDLGRRRWDGLLELRGRRDFQVKLLGTRLELTEIELALAAHETVTECAVVALSDGDGLVTHLVAYVVPVPGSSGGGDAWRAHLRRRFGPALPVSFHTMKECLPRNVAGKVDRHRLPDPRLALATGRPPTTRTERALAGIWSALLGSAPASADDSFFAAGGHSLLVPQLASRIRARWGADVPLRELFAHPTLAAMSTVVDAATPRSDAAHPDNDEVRYDHGRHRVVGGNRRR